jgi:hypothetical protein
MIDAGNFQASVIMSTAKPNKPARKAQGNAMSAHDALVTDYIERMSGEILDDRYRPQLAELIRGHSGIYALYKEDDLYYVGLAVDLMRRVDQHLKDRHRGAWNRFSVYLTQRDEHLKPLEALLLRVLKPSGNQQSGRLPGASDRKRALAQAMKQRDAQWRDAALGRPSRKTPARPRPDTFADGTPMPPRIAAFEALPRPQPLQATYKGVVYRATLMKNGEVKLDGVRYGSLSAAAVSIVQRNMNGWWVWKVRNVSGDWVRLVDLGG